MEKNNYIAINRHIGSYGSFLDVDLFNLEKIKLNTIKALDKDLIDSYGNMLQELSKKNIESLSHLRAAVFCDLFDELDEINQIFHIQPLTEKSKITQEINKQYLLNSLDFTIYCKAASGKQMTNEVSDFHQVKEYLFFNEDYRDQLEFFIEMRKEYSSESDGILQMLLKKEHEGVIRYVKGLYNIYNEALKFLEKKATIAQACRA